MKQLSSVKYYIDDALSAHMFPAGIQHTISLLHEFIGDTHQVAVFPDAARKKFGLPCGLALISKLDDAVLMPSHLRDPGCGYILFRIDAALGDLKSLQSNIGKELSELVDGKLKNSSLLNKQFPSIKVIPKIIAQGLKVFPDLANEENKFGHTNFVVDQTVCQLSKLEQFQLYYDLLSVTNTVEVRTIINPNNAEQSPDHLIGFIHTGSDSFPRILAKRFIQKVLDYTEDQQSATAEMHAEGIQGVPLQHELGYEYYQWLKAAMNFSLVNRYCTFLEIKKSLEASLPCSIKILSDNIHAGVLEETIQNNTILKSLRGVQNLNLNVNSARPTLIAGQRETIAALAEPALFHASSYDLIAHGTGYEINSKCQYSQCFTDAEIVNYQNFAKQCYYNTDPELDKCLPYTYNLLKMLSYFEQEQIAQTTALLAPFINIQSAAIRT